MFFIQKIAGNDTRIRFALFVYRGLRKLCFGFGQG